MGSGVSAGVALGVREATADDLQATTLSISDASRLKLLSALNDASSQPTFWRLEDCEQDVCDCAAVIDKFERLGNREGTQDAKACFLIQVAEICCRRRVYGEQGKLEIVPESVRDAASVLGKALAYDPGFAHLGWIPIHGEARRVIGWAPPAPRPGWLPACGPGIANIPALEWSLSVEQWIFFVRACAKMDTWRVLAAAKGEYNITMYDMNEHFVTPWTKGTGCSIALLLNSKKQSEVEIMLSHSWAGSVIESHNSLLNMVNLCDVPSTASIFFCTFCLYQPNDGAMGGMSIQDQLNEQPFAKIIHHRPKHGLFVLHTTVSEVYDRLWVVHEADSGLDADIPLRGLFDIYRWSEELFCKTSHIQTAKAKCGVDSDRKYIQKLITERGGYDRLDSVISKFRADMQSDLQRLQTMSVAADAKESHPLGDMRFEQTEKFDWCYWKGVADDTYTIGGTFDFAVDFWKFGKRWKLILENVANEYGPHAPSTKQEVFPLGSDSFPFETFKHGWPLF